MNQLKELSRFEHEAWHRADPEMRVIIERLAETRKELEVRQSDLLALEKKLKQAREQVARHSKVARSYAADHQALEKQLGELREAAREFWVLSRLDSIVGVPTGDFLRYPVVQRLCRIGSALNPRPPEAP